MPVGASAMVALANITLGSSASEVNFTSISSGYRDLILQINGSISSGTATVLLQFNGDGSTSTYWTVMTGDGGTKLAQTADWTNLYTTYGYYNMTTSPSVIQVDAMDYSATDKHKSFLVRSSAAYNSVSALAGRRASTAAISSIRVFLNTSNFAAGTNMSLYGVSA
jgi:hypothetical protein